MRRQLYAVALLICTPSVTSSCAINQLRIEEGHDVATAGNAAVAATRSYLQKVDDTRTRVSLDIGAADVNCVDGSYVLLRPQLTAVRDPERPPRGWLCQSHESTATQPAPLRTGPLGRELDPMLALLDALAAYDNAILKIVEEKAPDPGKDLADAFALARSAEDVLRAGFGGNAIIPAAADHRLTAVTGFVNLIALLDREQDQVSRLRMIAAETESQQLIATLREHLDNWELARATSMTLSSGLAGTLYGQSTRIDPPLPAAVRRQYAANWYLLSGPDHDAELAKALKHSFAALATADEGFRNALHPRPRLNDAQNKRLAELTRQRLIAIFDSLTSIINVVKGG